MDITFVTTANTDDEAYSLLKEIGLPFKKKISMAKKINEKHAMQKRLKLINKYKTKREQLKKRR